MSLGKQTINYLLSEILNNKSIIESLIYRYLPDDLKQHADLDTLKSCKKNYIDENLKSSCLDSLFSLKIFKKIGYIYILFTRQSKICKLLPIYVARYISEIMIDFAGNGNKVPFVYPLVLCDNLSVCRGTNDIKELINAPKKIVEKFVFNYFSLIDLNASHNNNNKSEDDDLHLRMLQYSLSPS